MSEPTNVLITGEAGKLPAPYAGLIDPQKPLPAEAAFFEKRITIGQMTGTAGFAVGFALVGVVCTVVGFSFLFGHGVARMTKYDYLPFVFGLVCLLAAWMMFSSLWTRWTTMQRQQAGEPVRLGIFLLPDALFEVNEFGYCVVPKAHFRGLDGNSVRYFHGGEEKTFRLPDALVKGEPADLIAAVGRWAGAGPAK